MKRKLFRLMSAVLAVLTLLTTVFAFSYDLSGDGKTNVWDLQMAVNQEKPAADQAAAMQEALGGMDELHPNGENVYEIWSALGLYHMASISSEGHTFKLMQDIDLGGAEWLPVEKFCGIFDGQGHTISNATITKCGEDSFQGFFATVDFDANRVQSVVKNLNLENIQVIAADDAQYIGLFAGQVRGIIQDCTVTGFITDNRTNLAKTNYMGPFAGRLNNSNPDGVLKYTKDFDHFLAVNSGAVGETVADDNVEGITSKMGMHFATLAEGSKSRTVGLVGAYPEEASLVDETGKVTWNWQDITNSSDYVSAALRERRLTVAQYMYDQGTVYWTPSKDLRLLVYKSGASDRSKSDYSSKKLYRGIPYNHGSSGLERFNYWVNNPQLPADAFYLTDNKIIEQFNDAVNTGNYTMVNGMRVVSSLTSEYGKIFYNTTYNQIPSDWDPTLSVSGTYITGFGRYIGNDCSSAAAWAWRQVSAVDTKTSGFTRPTSTSDMFPSPRHMTGTGSDNTGIVAVNGLSFADPMVKNSAGNMVNTYSSKEYGNVVNAAYDANPGSFLDALSHTSMGDCLMAYKSAGGHTLMLMGDAVTIRDKKGKIQQDLSYVITTEQGGGGSTGTRKSDGKAWESSWSVNKKRSYAEVVGYGKTSSTSEYRYFPITCTALREENTPAVTAWCKLENGTVSSNFHIVSTQVGDEIIYTKTVIAGSRSACTSVKISDFHTAETGTVTVYLANGENYTFEF